MHLTRVRLVNVRNHRRTDIEPTPGANVLVGANAQGKSTVLEAVEVAATGRSSRAQREGELITLGESWARIHVTNRRTDRHEDVDLAFRRDDSSPLARQPWREIRINDVPVRRGELFGRLLCVAVGPAAAEVVGGAPAGRRRILDVLLAQISPAYYYTAQRYGRAVAQRNRLLREGAGTAALGPWDEQVASLGALITMRRHELVARLAVAAARIYRTLSDGREEFAITYVANLSGREEGELTQAARDAMGNHRPAELARGVTLVGPHRDEITLEVDGRLLRLYGSRGQQVAAVLALRLAERELLREESGEEPVLLLDDVVMTLDAARQAQVLAYTQGAQTFLTVTALSGLVELPPGAGVFRVTGGIVDAQHAHLT